MYRFSLQKSVGSQERFYACPIGSVRDSAGDTVADLRMGRAWAGCRLKEARMPSEQKWYALTGRVVDAKVEADGDIHIALEDATGNNVGTVSAEIPVGPKWCEIRQTVFGWTTQKFPFSVKTAHNLKIHEQHVIAVTGKAFYDIGHAPADQRCGEAATWWPR